MVSTSKVVCSTRTPRDIYFSKEECNTPIVEKCLTLLTDSEGTFRMDKKKMKRVNEGFIQFGCFQTKGPAEDLVTRDSTSKGCCSALELETDFYFDITFLIS